MKSFENLVHFIKTFSDKNNKIMDLRQHYFLIFNYTRDNAGLVQPIHLIDRYLKYVGPAFPGLSIKFSEGAY